MDIEVVASVTRTIGSLALVYPYLRRLGVADLIDELTTTGKERTVSTGQVIEVLILNRLSLQPTPISKVGAWAASQAIEAVYGIAASALNDDRIGRALDELHPHLVDAWATIVLRGAQAYGVKLDRLHSDVTRVAFEGAYDGVATTTADGRPLAQIRRGYTGKQDPSRKQVTVSLSVAADGALPTWYQVADGNAADTRVYLEHLAAVRQWLDLARPLVVGDSKLVTQATLLGFCRVGARFIGPTRLTAADRATLDARWQAGEPMWRLDPPPVEATPVAARYWGLEQAEMLVDSDRGTDYALRRLFVQSLDDRRATRHQRAKDLAGARRALWTIRARLGRPAYRDPALVRRKVADAVRKVRDSLHVTVVEAPPGLAVHWRLDRARLRETTRFDGIYALVTNLSPVEATAPGVFREYKGQIQVERRFRAVKHPPIQIRPLWLHQPHRIESLIFVIMVALFLFALLEREARRVVRDSGQVLTGLRPDGRDHRPVTAERLLEVFAPLSLVTQCLRVGTALVQTLTPATLSPIQAQLLDRLGLPRPHAYLPPTVSLHPT
ncbi:MAG TPA: IS1634 family transposase [Mycobacteriales bacterium]|nr:IS1634 family transposase [Mycobacteriales bacterium]